MERHCYRLRLDTTWLGDDPEQYQLSWIAENVNTHIERNVVSYVDTHLTSPFLFPRVPSRQTASPKYMDEVKGPEHDNLESAG